MRRNCDTIINIRQLSLANKEGGNEMKRNLKVVKREIKKLLPIEAKKIKEIVKDKEEKKYEVKYNGFLFTKRGKNLGNYITDLTVRSFSGFAENASPYTAFSIIKKKNEDYVSFSLRLKKAVNAYNSDIYRGYKNYFLYNIITSLIN
jgi:hypothetical protein